MLSDAALQFLRSAPLAHLTTLDADGSPHVSLAWVDATDDGVIEFATMFDQPKLANMRRDPRVAISFESSVVEPSGLRQYLVVRGTATITEGGAADLLRRLAGRYIGPDADFPPMADPPPGFVTHVTPTRVSGVGPWKRED
jgi:PPOX class probable F420-dependent enzyme